MSPFPFVLLLPVWLTETLDPHRYKYSRVRSRNPDDQSWTGSVRFDGPTTPAKLFTMFLQLMWARSKTNPDRRIFGFMSTKYPLLASVSPNVSSVCNLHPLEILTYLLAQI